MRWRDLIVGDVIFNSWRGYALVGCDGLQQRWLSLKDGEVIVVGVADHPVEWDHIVLAPRALSSDRTT